MIHVELVSWQSHADALLAIRFRVFVEEQGVPPELEPDDQDPHCWHVVAGWRDRPDGDAGAQPAAGGWVGTARMTGGGRIGRMAVLAPWRGRGVGAAMLDRLAELAADRAIPRLTLLAQLHALSFYEKHGFRPHGPEVEEAGIRHRAMSRLLT